MEPKDEGGGAADEVTLAMLARRVAAMEGWLLRQGYRPPLVEPSAEREVHTPPTAAFASAPVPPSTQDVSSPAEMLAAMRRAVAMKQSRATPPPLPPVTPAARVEPVDEPPLEPLDLPPLEEIIPRQPLPYATPFRAASPPNEHVSMEQAIGLKAAGWIGAIIVVIGAAMGVRYAYDQGWLGGFPDEAKLALLYAIALAIVGAGEYVYRRIDPRGSVGVFAAGVASLFVVGYAGSAYFRLYDPVTAFGLMAAACAVGAMIALRTRFVSIAVLSHLGANLAPLILRDRAVSEVPLLAYLLALQVMAVGLAHIGSRGNVGGRWWMLRSLALVTTTLWMTGRLLDSATAHSLPTIIAAAVYAAIFQLELILAAARENRRPLASESAAKLATFSLAVTGAFVGELLRWSDPLPPFQRGGALVALAMLAGTAGAATLSMNGRALRSLATSWLTQAALLLVLAVPVSLAGPAITIAWAGLAVAYAVLGYALVKPRTLLAGVGVWVVAVVHLTATLVTGDSHGSLRSTVLSINGIDIPAYLALALLLGFAGHLIALLAGARRMRKTGEASKPPRPEMKPSASSENLPIADVMAIAATLAWIIALLAALPPLNATIGLLAVAWTLFIIGQLASRELYMHGSIAVILLALAKWTAVDVLGERVAPGGAADRDLLFNVPMAIGAACTATLAILLWLTRGKRTDEGNRSSGFAWISVIAATLALTVGLSVEVERAVRMAAASGSLIWMPMQATLFGWTILWTAAAFVPAIFARAIEPAPQRRTVAWQAAGVAAAMIAGKFIVFDSVIYAAMEPRVQAMAVFNLQMLVALVVMVGLILAARRPENAPLKTALRTMMFAVPLVIGSIELDRQLGPERTLIAWSAFWGLYAIASIVLGFARRSASFRFAGLGLLGVTLLKIVVVDLASASTGWRILSFLAVGIVLLITSVLYGKLSPRLLGEQK